jgi:DNA repair protein RadC
VLYIKIIKNQSQPFFQVNSDPGNILTNPSIESNTLSNLDAQNRMTDIETIQEGIVNQAVVYPRKVLENALKKKASAVILVHNHPSGHVKPSDADIRLTKTIQETARILDIIVHDHVIIGENRFFSFREEGLI